VSEERRRTKYDIYADIVDIIARKGLCSLTRVSYGANMPVDRTKKELNFLMAHGFITEVQLEDSKKYRATKWGLEYLETCSHHVRRLLRAPNDSTSIHQTMRWLG
jgi:predicted transcriptional regulator